MDAQELSELSQSSPPAKKTAITSPVSAFGTWPNQDAHLQKQDKLWQEGLSGTDLLRQKSPTVVKKQAKASQEVGPQRAPSPIERAKNDESVTLAGGAIRGDSEVVGSSWNSPGSQEPTIDENILHKQHDVVGAYGQVVDGDNFRMSLGPELYIPDEGADVLGKGDADASELGMSMKFKWGF